jgi:hypothetical protein
MNTGSGSLRPQQGDEEGGDSQPLLVGDGGKRHFLPRSSEKHLMNATEDVIINMADKSTPWGN